MQEVTDYKYLGVVLASDCGWAAHAQYVLAKASKTVHAFGAVLHNKRVSTVVRIAGRVRGAAGGAATCGGAWQPRLGAGCCGPGQVGAGAKCSPTPHGLV